MSMRAGQCVFALLRVLRLIFFGYCLCGICGMARVIEPKIQPNFAAQNKLFGVTLDSIKDLNPVISIFKNAPHQLTVRVVFDEFMPPTYYLKAINSIHKV